MNRHALRWTCLTLGVMCLFCLIPSVLALWEEQQTMMTYVPMSKEDRDALKSFVAPEKSETANASSDPSVSAHDSRSALPRALFDKFEKAQETVNLLLVANRGERFRSLVFLFSTGILLSLIFVVLNPNVQDGLKRERIEETAELAKSLREKEATLEREIRSRVSAEKSRLEEDLRQRTNSVAEAEAQLAKQRTAVQESQKALETERSTFATARSKSDAELTKKAQEVGQREAAVLRQSSALTEREQQLGHVHDELAALVTRLDGYVALEGRDGPAHRGIEASPVLKAYLESSQT